MDNVSVRGQKGFLKRIKLEDRYKDEGYYSVELVKEGKTLNLYAVEISEIRFL